MDRVGARDVIELKSPREITALRAAGAVVARALAAVRNAADVGVTLKELDDVAAGVALNRLHSPTVVRGSPSRPMRSRKSPTWCGA